MYAGRNYGTCILIPIGTERSFNAIKLLELCFGHDSNFHFAKNISINN